MLKSPILFTLLIITLLLQSSCAQKAYKMAFYNVENLFDTIDDPKTKDEEFTPTGKKKWDAERYQAKLDNIAKVLDSLGSPEMFGLVEVENKQVLEDLVTKTTLNRDEYGIIHRDSPDFRGIDVAFVYKQKHFKVLEMDFITINFPVEIVEDYTTREILYVKGKVGKKEELHVFVNHWPSRRGGLAKSEPKRIYVAQQLKKAVDKILAEDENANIVIMGDFNDEPNNKSIKETLGALPGNSPLVSKSLYNYFYSFDKDEKGSYNYRGNWNMLDQFIVSTALKDAKGLQAKNPVIFRAPWLMYKSKKNGETPSRTYGGPNYYGGYSDHLPILIELVWNK